MRLSGSLFPDPCYTDVGVVIPILPLKVIPYMKFAALPKVELHLHLDCSLSYEVVRTLNPAITEEEYREEFIAPAKCHDLADYITRASRGIELMQTKEQLRLVTLDLFEQLQADNIIYAEIRYAPLQHLQKGLSPREVVQAVNEATLEGMARTGIRAGVILCTLRHFSEEQSMTTVRLVDEFIGGPVVGFDIAADEAGYPIDAHLSAFSFAQEKGFPCTAHAGEAKGPESVWETLEHFHPRRIGHGVRSYEDPKLLEYLKQKGIHLEVCPTSNIQTDIYDTIQEHTVDQLYRLEVSMSISTDCRTVSNVTLGSEYQLLHEVFDWERAHFLRCNLDAIDHAFATNKVKASLRKKILAGFAETAVVK